MLLRRSAGRRREHAPHPHRESRRDRRCASSAPAAGSASKPCSPHRRPIATRCRHGSPIAYGLHRPATSGDELSEGRRPWCRRRCGTGCDADPSGLRLSLRARRARAPVRAARHHVHRPDGRAARGGRATSCGARRSAGGRRAGGARRRGEFARRAQALARRIGVPLLVKAVGGGGGRGMKRVERVAGSASRALELAAAEARRGLRRRARVPGALSCDAAGTSKCRCWATARRRHPPGRARLLGAAPLPEAHRGDAGAGPVGGACARAARRPRCASPTRLHYRGAGTVEFLVDASASDFYLSRDERAHPGRASGHRGGHRHRPRRRADRALPTERACGCAQCDVRLDGCAIECRVNAEDPAQRFRAQPGRGATRAWPAGAGIRVDTHIEAGASVPPFYDSLLGKIIAHGARSRRRAGAAARGHRATRDRGRRDQSRLARRVLADPEFAAGGVDTGFVARLARTRAVRGRSARSWLTSQLVETSLARRQPVPVGALGIDTAQTLSIAPVMDRGRLQAPSTSPPPRTWAWRCATSARIPGSASGCMAAATPNTPLQFMGTGFRFISWETAQPRVHGAGVSARWRATASGASASPIR